MSQKKLTRRQHAVIDELFTGELGEQAILDKHRVARWLFKRWLADEAFCAEFDTRMAHSYRESELIIARFAPVAAARLVELTGSEKEETRRKACLDIIAMPEQFKPRSADKTPAEPEHPQIPPEIAQKLLTALAQADTTAQ